jgi:tetratricopeptide (TPR) repeat protein
VSECTAAITAGCALFAAGDAAGALREFQACLELPGAGVKKDRKLPAALSTGEKQAAYFNLAVAHTALGELDHALEALEMCLRCGYGARSH